MARRQNGAYPYAEGGLERWHEGVRISHIGHVRTAIRDGRLGRGLGVLVTGLAAAVGTAQFVTISNSPSTTLKVVAGVVAFIATVAAAINTFMGYGTLSEQHSNASHRYGRIRREMEEWHMEATLGEVAPKELRHKWELAWNEAEAASPPVPDRIYKKVRDEVKATGGGSFIAPVSSDSNAKGLQTKVSKAKVSKATGSNAKAPKGKGSKTAVPV